MKFVNLTPHAIDFYDNDGNHYMTVEPYGAVVRLDEKVEQVGDAAGVPVVRKNYSISPKTIQLVEHLLEGGNMVIVSPIMLPYFKGFDDVYAPDTGPDSVVRDKEGRIIGVKRLIVAG